MRQKLEKFPGVKTFVQHQTVRFKDFTLQVFRVLEFRPWTCLGLALSVLCNVILLQSFF